jgi:hypothetical protein
MLILVQKTQHERIIAQYVSSITEYMTQGAVDI